MTTLLKKTLSVFKKDKGLLFALLFVLGILILRLYKIDGFATFLGDQGRDAIIIKRIATLEHLTAIGPVTSIGQIFLGPFYYYLVAPWLLIFRLDPLGLAVGVAVISSALLLWIYYLTKKLFSEHLAWFVLIASGFATVLHSFARFSWNPNLLPYVSFLLVLTTQQMFKTKKVLGALVLGALLSVAIQLHYIALVLVPPVAIMFVFYFFFEKKNIKKIINLALVSFSSFIVISLPLIIFDLRHDFLNIKNFLKLFTDTETVGGGRFSELILVFQALNKFVFRTEFSFNLNIILIVGLAAMLIYAIKKNRHYSVVGIFFIFLMVGLSMYGGPKYVHYLGSLYIIYLAVIGIVMLSFPKKISFMLTSVFLIIFTLISVRQYDFLQGASNYQMRHAKRVSTSIIPNIKSDKFQITSLPERYSDYSYRYFLEAEGKRPLEKDTLEKADELYVLCETKCDTIIGHPTWDIAFFAPKKIAKQWVVENVTIYKLVR